MLKNFRSVLWAIPGINRQGGRLMRYRKNRSLLFVLLCLFIVNVSFTINAVTPKNEPVGDPKAIRGGELILHTPEFPKSFNYFVNNDSDAATIFGLVYDTLLEMHPNTLEFMPLIAKSWQISSDKKTFTFTINPRAKWADGMPITAADVQFTYDTIMNPKNLTSVQRMALVRFNPPVIINQRAIKFIAKTVHYNNFINLASLNILPQHLFAGRDFNKTFNMGLPPGSGPYVLSEVREGRYLCFKAPSGLLGRSASQPSRYV